VRLLYCSALVPEVGQSASMAMGEEMPSFEDTEDLVIDVSSFNFSVQC
jgi:hypothetical protein